MAKRNFEKKKLFPVNFGRYLPINVTLNLVVIAARWKIY